MIFLFLPMSINAQKLSNHQWKNRLVLVLTNDTTDANYQNQLKIFQTEKEGMKERKLLVYHITPTQYCIENDNKEWHNSSKLYTNYKQTNASFEVILIGLDGRIKLTQNEVLTTDKLFAIIDAMPMRRAELRRKKRQY